MRGMTIFEVSYERAAKEALQVQDACNLSGVALSFVSAILAVKSEAAKQGRGAQWVSRHPIIFLFEDKIADLLGRSHFDDLDRYHEATEECKQIAGLKEAGTDGK